MAKKPKATTPVAEEKIPLLIFDLETLKQAIEDYKWNPLEQVMAMRLLMNGYDFYYQYKLETPEGWVIDGRKYFIADFYIPQMKLIIETEGKIHCEESVINKDRNRFNAITSMGHRYFRFSWDDVMFSNEYYDIMKLFDELNINISIEEWKNEKKEPII